MCRARIAAIGLVAQDGGVIDPYVAPVVDSEQYELGDCKETGEGG